MKTKEERHLLYKDLLNQYLSDIKEGINYGLCLSLVRVSDHLEIDQLPELISLKPNPSGILWFSVYDTQSRINILKQCIKMTE